MLSTKTIGNKIVEARKKMKLSQAELAQRVAISAQAVGKWERGESMPDIATFSRLALILDVDLNYFAYTTTEPTGTTKDTEVSKEEIETIKNNPAGRQNLSFNAIDLRNSDFAGVTMLKSRFKVCPLINANFQGADLSGSIFQVLDAQNANFDKANLTDCVFSISELQGASFDKSTLTGTTFTLSGKGAIFSNAKFDGATFTTVDLKGTSFQKCKFHGTTFRLCEMEEMNLANNYFTDVEFEKCSLENLSFEGATLNNVRFTSPWSITNKYYKKLTTIKFKGAIMDKVTYAMFQNMRILDLTGVIIK
ncbi:hypothetical protein AXE80_05740 [Wenyingzhuangia fucanilytica]|uniref:HTH cro/C1-type domain-containing protein n=1 Tax=Wenyingzhuangia fucanilytica TaxID=1790137 RepID=A0A1B1Y4W5_9FLAO|nr:pentapeptide repeat-containing protein [Wenyingzhuangia fucanilytica]ANW95812.1 hypothetical protein AXE80_05740 [Wenyingzhuangia fucanilytica]